MRVTCQKSEARRRWFFNEGHVLLALVLIALFVWVTTYNAVRAADDWARQLLIGKAQTVAALVNPASVRLLALSDETLAQQSYAQLVALLARIKKADGTSRFVYLMGLDEQGVFFLADSEPPSSQAHSPLGQRYESASDLLVGLFDGGEPFVEGPIKDDWGSWVSAHAPVVDPDTGKVIALVGVDVSASLWLREARIDRAVLALPYIMVGATFVMVLVRRKMLSRLSYAATHDQLTGLFNRHEFAAQVRSRSGKGNEQGALMLLDVDDLKYVNDIHSHAQGDIVLRQAASAIRETAGAHAVVGRQGGDEFAVALPICAWNDALRIASEVVQAVSAACSRGQDYAVTASLGLADLIGQTSFESSLALADEALRAAKQAGKNRVHARSSAEGGATSSHRQNTVRRVAAALKGHDFELWLQPVYRIAPKAVVFHEALLRLKGPDEDKPDLPSEFLPAALEAGLMPQIDLWVLQEALEMLERTRAGFRVSVNLSGITLADAESLDRITKLVSSPRAKARRLLFEITESNSLADLATTREWVEHMHRLGCGFAIDDFGEGYCSYRYLRELKVDYVKIDGRYVRTAIADSHARALIRSVREFAHAAGSKVIAEHVETPEQVAVLRTEGIEYAQGFLLGPPEPASIVLRELLSRDPANIRTGRGPGVRVVAERAAPNSGEGLS